MNLISRLLVNLLPGGFAWRIFGDTKKVIQGIGTFFNRAKLYVEQGIAESRPISSVDELPNWFRALGLTYDPNQPLQSRQGRASQLFAAIGGQSKTYIEGIIQQAFPQITIEPFTIEYDSMAGRGMAGLMMATNYPSWVPLEYQDGTFPWYIFRVVGEVDGQTQFIQLQDIIARIAPARLLPVYQDIELFVDVMMAGVGEAGRGMAGRYPDQAPVNPIIITLTDDDGLPFTVRTARFDGTGIFDGRTLLNPQANYNVTTVKFGTGTTPPDPSDTDLETPVESFTLTAQLQLNGTRKYTCIVDKASLNGIDITECGLFGPFGMVWRAVFSAQTKDNTKNIFFTFNEEEIF